MTGADFIIIGAGMAGASAAYWLSEQGSVILLEMEGQAGYHTTGRSAALYSESYGNFVIRALTSGGRGFFTSPPEGFAAHPLLRPRGALFIAREDQLPALDALKAEVNRLHDGIERLDGAGVRAIVPVLRESYVAGGLNESAAMDMDVDAIHQGFLRGARARGGRLVTGAEVTGLARRDGAWRIDSRAGKFQAPVLVNAAGAWCDAIAGLAGARPVGLVPKRRTAILVPPPDGADIARWPLTVDVDEQFYMKPDAGKLLCSPADETPSPPCDAQPEELDIALTVDRLQTAADFTITRIEHRWAGLRSFVADKTPVVGFDPELEGFFWLAGQGGYGIQTAPALGRVSATLATGGPIPDDLAALGIAAADLSPARFHTA